MTIAGVLPAHSSWQFSSRFVLDLFEPGDLSFGLCFEPGWFAGIPKMQGAPEQMSDEVVIQNILMRAEAGEAIRKESGAGTAAALHPASSIAVGAYAGRSR